MNKSKVILILKSVVLAAFLVAVGLALSKANGVTGMFKTMLILSGALGLFGFIISFLESASNSKKQKESSKQVSLAQAEIAEKNQEIDKITEEVKGKTLLSERVAKISRIIQEAEDIKVASSEILETLAHDIEICQGVLYVTDEIDGVKHLTGAGTYAYHKLESDLDQPRFGVGLVGQTAQEKKSLYINELPNGYIDVVSGLGKAQPSNLSLIPLMYSGEVLGVIELASFAEFTDTDKELFEGIKDALGAGIHFLQQAQILENLETEIRKLKAGSSPVQIEETLEEVNNDIPTEEIQEEVPVIEEIAEENEPSATEEEESEENND